MISNIKKFQINSTLSTNIIFGFFPISFVFGNLITNINLILFCALGIFHLKSKILTIKFDLLLKIIFLLFFIIFFSTSLSFINFLYFEAHESNNLTRFIKSILFFRFFIMLLIVYLLSELDIINFKYFFLSAFLSSLLISIDVIFQYTFGFNIIGLESYGHHNTSFLGDELIAGGFIQNFSFFAIFFAIYLLRNNNYYFRSILLVIVICALAIGIVVSGNRMPFILFLFGLFLVFLFNKKLKKIALISFLTMSIILGFIMSFDKNIKNSYLSLFLSAKDIVVSAKNSSSEIILKPLLDIVMVNPGMNPELIDNPEHEAHKKLFFTGIETWKLHKIFGNGMKSFREDCKRIIIDQKRGICSNHPHNYYLEILTDLGIVGFIFVIAFALMFIVFVIKNYRVFNGNNLVSFFLSAATISFFLEVFPFKSTGSIFTTNNATYIILMLAIILSHKKLLQNKNFGKYIPY